MKNILFPILILLMLISVMPSYAQRNNGRLGIKGGATFNKLTDHLYLYDNYYSGDTFEYSLGFHVGLFYTIESRWIRVQPGLMFVQKNSRLKINTRNRFPVYERQKLSYLQLPIELSFKLVEFGENGGFRLNIEPHTGVCVDAKAKVESVSTDINIGMEDSNDIIYPFDYGVSLGVSFDLGIIEPYFAYDIGVMNICNIKDHTLYNRSMNFGVAIHF
ncbi:MAG: porin family protein [Prolixibacteraceae bacterium]